MKVVERSNLEIHWAQRKVKFYAKEMKRDGQLFKVIITACYKK